MTMAAHWLDRTEQRADELARERQLLDLRAERALILTRLNRIRALGHLGRKLSREAAAITHRIIAIENGRSS
jgi:hypothetical protein